LADRESLNVSTFFHRLHDDLIRVYLRRVWMLKCL
jgi:hypothetical protein